MFVPVTARRWEGWGCTIDADLAIDGSLNRTRTVQSVFGDIGIACTGDGDSVARSGSLTDRVA
ncbi:MAG: hypothetical protein AAFY30_14040 [Cyanobacteria bacterium J06642_12]